MSTDEEKQEFHKAEYHGTPLCEHMTFRCTSTLMRFIRTKGMEEGRDYSAVIRRYVTIGAALEGYNKDAI